MKLLGETKNCGLCKLRVVIVKHEQACPMQARPATDDVTIILLTDVLCFATELSTLLVPLTAGSIKSLCGSSTSMRKGDLQ